MVIVLSGPCLGLRVNGVANDVTIDLRDGAVVRIEGSANRVIYRVKTGVAPNVVALGQGNRRQRRYRAATDRRVGSVAALSPVLDR